MQPRRPRWRRPHSGSIVGNAEVGAEQCVVQETEASRGAGVDFRGIRTTATQPCARMFSPGNRITWGHSETHSRERIQRELSNVETVNVSGAHMDFLFTSWERVVAVMRRFLGASAPQQMSDRR